MVCSQMPMPLHSAALAEIFPWSFAVSPMEAIGLSVLACSVPRSEQDILSTSINFFLARRHALSSVILLSRSGICYGICGNILRGCQICCFFNTHRLLIFMTNSLCHL